MYLYVLVPPLWHFKLFGVSLQLSWMVSAWWEGFPECCSWRMLVPYSDRILLTRKDFWVILFSLPIGAATLPMTVPPRVWAAWAYPPLGTENSLPPKKPALSLATSAIPCSPSFPSLPLPVGATWNKLNWAWHCSRPPVWPLQRSTQGPWHLDFFPQRGPEYFGEYWDIHAEILVWVLICSCWYSQRGLLLGKNMNKNI